jgi:nucleotide-binding universal stress UspA family protein
MKASKIVFPTDFSEGSHAMSVAASLARDTGAEILIVNVSEPPAAYGDGEVHLDLLRQNDQMLEAMLSEVVPPDLRVRYCHRLLHGDPATEIMRVAKEEQADMIVMGTHGRTGLMRLLMGSVAEAVVRRATCPVLTCKRPAECPDAVLDVVRDARK